LVAGRNVEIEQKDIDRYGRVVGLVKVGGQNLNDMIIQNSYAWVYWQYCKEKFCTDWVKSEGVARQQRNNIVSARILMLTT
jgi:endonuclease YncB( thermonuclease family)